MSAAGPRRSPRFPVPLAALAAALALAAAGAGRRPPGLGDLAAVRVARHGAFDRFVLELSRPADYRTGRLERPPRFYVDLPGIWVGGARTLELATRPPVERVRAGQPTLERGRVVLDLAAPVEGIRVFALEAPPRIVIDVPRGQGAAPAAPSPAFDARPVRRVVLDPGHGGRDPGARVRGVAEKDVTLRIARAAARRLRAAGLEVLLTREDDAYLPLEARTDFANRVGADLFVSIHANAAPRSRSRGVETYLLDTRYDRQTARVAARENGTPIEELDELHRILASLELGYRERFAARLADRIHGALVRALRGRYPDTRDLGVKRGPFLVLFSAEMPAVLVEVGFLTNPTERRRLASHRFVETAAEGIARGILAYREEHARGLLAGR